ncbi:hypothetical protein [Azospirillum sp. SYSU D00513]|uniref:hypothetical protein n=1 Tax=Azospirillum sp. SYSU D00513 TaxID=2812561 RepID=UPI001A97B314|nr:hypothetical protein [Azospirillum sp. SYSU D00513]
MAKLQTGKTFELRGTPDRLREIWPAVKAADTKAVIVTAASDNVGVIGTNDPQAAALGKLSLEKAAG